MCRLLSGSDHDKIGAIADGNAAGAPAAGLRAAPRSRAPQRAAGMPISGGGHVAAALLQSLGIFQQTQFPKRVERRVAVGADPKAIAGLQRGREIKYAVAKIGFLYLDTGR